VATVQRPDPVPARPDQLPADRTAWYVIGWCELPDGSMAMPWGLLVRGPYRPLAAALLNSGERALGVLVDVEQAAIGEPRPPQV
jgi:hypothetical protein